MRTLVVDIGEALGCGAHVVALRRLAVGHYQASQMVSLAKLQELAAKNADNELIGLLLPIETMLVSMPELTLTADMVHYVSSGQPIFISNTPNVNWVKLKNKDGKFLGVGEVMSDGKVAPRRIIHF